ncbi:9907_t:CDS:1 [Dentiscutata heterogama]|uniref:9907_t:CDS:1 n=1 Tax=Dentiscutata heterogama TaxID=1316150 RepID=A0ACA9K844_9GLOM|nr:9907_t:CDS:1 [Dentiscutata heterogama]
MITREVRNILIIGRSGNGKSALANTLVNREGEFKQIFKEGSGSVSETRESQSEIFEWNGFHYRLVDTIGLGDTKLSNKDVLYSIAKTIGMMKEGISHLLFIVDGKFNEDEKKNFRLLKEVMFESRISNYTTIVRTRFEKFRNRKDCDLDKKNLLSESKDIAEIIWACNGLIHVDNPSLDISSDDDIDEDERQLRILVRKKDKIKSREKLLNHLRDNYIGNYKLSSWDKMYLRINNYIEKCDERNYEEEETITIELAAILYKEVPSFIKTQQSSSEKSLWCQIL